MKCHNLAILHHSVIALRTLWSFDDSDIFKAHASIASLFFECMFWVASVQWESELVWLVEEDLLADPCCHMMHHPWVEYQMYRDVESVRYFVIICKAFWFFHDKLLISVHWHIRLIRPVYILLCTDRFLNCACHRSLYHDSFFLSTLCGDQCIMQAPPTLSSKEYFRNWSLLKEHKKQLGRVYDVRFRISRVGHLRVFG